jgi:uncharacterized protein
LLSGSHQIDELPGHWASALVTTTTLPISFLDEGDARDLIVKPIEDFPAIYTPEAVDRIVALTHCQPYMIQLVCAVLVERMNRAHRLPPDSYVTLDDVAAAIPVALERGQNYFIDLWSNQTGSAVARQVLEAMASAPNQQLARSAMRELVRDETALRDALITLTRREIIDKTDDSYRITVPLVAEFIRRQAIV